MIELCSCVTGVGVIMHWLGQLACRPWTGVILLALLSLPQAMRQVASQKLVMNERQASSRTAVAASGKEGHILLGGLPVSQGVLRGKDLRSLMESQQTGFGAPVGGLLDGE